jgi:hypothetical protein
MYVEHYLESGVLLQLSYLSSAGKCTATSPKTDFSTSCQSLKVHTGCFLSEDIALFVLIYTCILYCIALERKEDNLPSHGTVSYLLSLLYIAKYYSLLH